MNAFPQPIIPEYLRGLKPANEAAYARFLATGLPAAKSEMFKYTNIAQVVDFRSATQIDVLRPVLAGATQYVHTEKFQPNQISTSALSILNAALADEMVVIDIPADTKGDEPIYLTWNAQHHRLVNPHVVINVGAGADVTIIETQSGQNTGWCNRVTDIQIGDGAALRHFRHLGGGGVTTQTTHAQIATKAIYQTFLLNAGGGIARHDVQLDLTGAQAHADLRCANLLKGTDHNDLTALVRHLVPQTSSNQAVRSVLMDQARGVYQGKIFVDRVAQKTDGYQLSKALLLSPGAEMDTKPELEIYADDVKCSHGATTGALDETQMFYLRSRGLPERDARALLLRGFVTELLDDLPDKVREMFEIRIDGWLA